MYPLCNNLCILFLVVVTDTAHVRAHSPRKVYDALCKSSQRKNDAHPLSTGRQWFKALDTLDAAIGERELDAALTAVAEAQGLVRTMSETTNDGQPCPAARCVHFFWWAVCCWTCSLCVSL